MSEEPNPIIKMLGWRIRKLSLEEVKLVLAAVASMGSEAFTLTDVIELLPPRIKASRKKRRSIGNLLQGLVSIGYLMKPSERKWVKRAPTLSHYLTQHLIDLSSLEKIPLHPPGGEKIVARRERLSSSSRESDRSSP